MVDISLGFIYASGSHYRKLFYFSRLTTGLKTRRNQALLLMLLKSHDFMLCLTCALTSI